MKRLVLTTFFVLQTCIFTSLLAQLPITLSSNLHFMENYAGLPLYVITGGDISITAGGTQVSLGNEIYIDNTMYYIPIGSNGLYGKTYTFNPKIYFNDNLIHRLGFCDSTKYLTTIPYPYQHIRVILQTAESDTACSNRAYTLCLYTYSTKRWERSSDNGISWTNIACTRYIYSETNPQSGNFLYRALNGDGTYSTIVKLTYQDAVPSSLIATPATNTKTVDETITLSSSATNATYSYQWNLNGTAISGATSATYSIPVIKAAHAGSYTCTVSNGCNSITSAAATLTVNKAAQTITFPDIPTKTYGDAAFTLPATTNKGLTIAYQSTNTAVATVSGNTVTIVAPGTSNIIASQTGTADYLAATGVTKSLTINKIAQTITLSATATKTYGDAAFTLPANTNKSKTITYTSSNTAVATVSGNTVTINGAGTTDITAIQAGDTYYYAAPTVTQTLTVNKANQTITFGTFSSKTFGDAAITLPITSSAGLTISYSSNNTAVASVSGNTLTINKAGTATITASQNGNSNYAAASSVSQDITIQKASQTIVWSNIPNKTYGDAAFTLPVTTDKGLTISYLSTDVNIATISGNTVTIIAAGTVNITASQVGSENFNAASSVTLPLSVSKAAQTITFADLPACTYGAAPLTLTATSSSGLTVTYESSDYSVATPSGNTLTLGNAGSCYITASVAGNANYLTGTTVQKLLTVNKASQTVTFDVIADKTYGDAAFSLSASATTSLPVTFSSSVPTNLIISGTTATIAGAGSYTITATQAGNSNYNSATATRTFTVNKAALIATADNRTRLYGDANPTLTTTYTGFVNGDSKAELAAIPVATTTATATATVGTYDITLSTITDANYTLTYRKGTLTINMATLTVTANAATKVYGDANPIFSVSYSGFKNSETSIVLTTQPVVTTVVKTMSNVGTYDLIGSGGAATNYDITYINGQLTVTKATLKVYSNDVTRTYGDANPTFTMNVTGYKGSDDATVLTSTPTASCSAIVTSPVGSYNITYSSGVADNYQFDYATTIGKLTVAKTVLSVTAENKTKEYGNANPTLTLMYSGFKNSETSSVLSTLPIAATTATTTSNVGTYNITVTGGVATNYSFAYNAGQLSISKAPLTISVKNDSISKGAAIPTFTLVYSGFKGSDNATKLDVLPTVSCLATSVSLIGKYDVVLQGGSDKNYSYTLQNGYLTIKDNTGLNDINSFNLSLYPVPTNSKVFIKSDMLITRVEVYSIDGRLMLLNTANDIKSIDLSRLMEGSYLFKLHSNSGISTKMVIKN